MSPPTEAVVHNIGEATQDSIRQINLGHQQAALYVCAVNPIRELAQKACTVAVLTYLCLRKGHTQNSQTSPESMKVTNFIRAATLTQFTPQHTRHTRTLLFLALFQAPPYTAACSMTTVERVFFVLLVTNCVVCEGLGTRPGPS